MERSGALRSERLSSPRVRCEEMRFPTDLDLLFHYTTAPVAVESILASGKLRLGLFEFTNDPRESKQWHISASIADGVTFDNDEFASVWAEADRLLRRSAKLACFTQDAKPYDEVDAVTGRGFGHSRLWSHYAGDHSGVCIGFDRGALVRTLHSQLASVGKSFSGPVSYVAAPSLPYDATHIDIEQVDEFGLDAVITRHVEHHWRELFFTKDVDWETEREYRWVVVNETPLPVFVDVSDCIRLIVLGESFSAARLPSVRHATKAMGDVAIAQIRYMTGRPQLVPAAEPTKPAVRPHRRSGDLAARAAALAAAEDTAGKLGLEGERLAASALVKLTDAVGHCAEQLRKQTEVEVQLLTSGHAAVPPADRQRAPGVTGGDVVYSAGIQCVVEHQPQYSFTPVCAVAVQALTGQRLRFHATYRSERWLPSGNEHTELWRARCEVPADEPSATQTAARVSAELEQQLDVAVAAYNSMRYPTGTATS